MRVSQPLLWAGGLLPAVRGGAEAGWSMSMTYGSNVTKISDSFACKTEESSLAFIWQMAVPHLAGIFGNNCPDFSLERRQNPREMKI